MADLKDISNYEEAEKINNNIINILNKFIELK